MNAVVNVDVQNVSSIAQVPESELINDWIREVLSVARPGEDSVVEMAVRIVDEDESRALNKRFRHVDKPTNVLAFPADDVELAALRDDTEAWSLGDLVICGPVVSARGCRAGKGSA